MNFTLKATKSYEPGNPGPDGTGLPPKRSAMQFYNEKKLDSL